MGNRGYIDAARRDIGRHDDLDPTFEQHPDHPITGVLRQVAMQGRDRVTRVS
jgi:hypothetical protein